MKPERYDLEELTHPIRAAFAGRRVRIWSGEWARYWRANASGYTSDANDAGVYTFGDAWRRAGHAVRKSGSCLRWSHGPPGAALRQEIAEARARILKGGDRPRNVFERIIFDEARERLRREGIR